MPYKMVVPTVNLGVRGLCIKPYPGHRKGCPNFGKKKACPPQAPPIIKVLDFAKPIYAIWNVFDFKTHCQRMYELHPAWSRRQVECCLYWQPKARKQLRSEIKEFCKCVSGQTVLACPEAAGVNITATMASIGQKLQWPPETVTYQVVIAGVKKNR